MKTKSSTSGAPEAITVSIRLPPPVKQFLLRREATPR